MGCCSSEMRKFPETAKPCEKEIQAQENKLMISHQKLKITMKMFESINFPLSLENIKKLCKALKFPFSDTTSNFLTRLANQKLLTGSLVKILIILLSKSKNSTKQNIFYFQNSENLLYSISQLINTAVYIIPMNIGIHDLALYKYSDKLKIVAENYIKSLGLLSYERLNF